jgi:hypothetical protein
VVKGGRLRSGKSGEVSWTWRKRGSKRERIAGELVEDKIKMSRKKKDGENWLRIK